MTGKVFKTNKKRIEKILDKVQGRGMGIPQHILERYNAVFDRKIPEMKTVADQEMVIEALTNLLKAQTRARDYWKGWLRASEEIRDEYEREQRERELREQMAVENQELNEQRFQNKLNRLVTR